jgi:ACR3 family arsenite efflux pump ArsB
MTAGIHYHIHYTKNMQVFVLNAFRKIFTFDAHAQTPYSSTYEVRFCSLSQNKITVVALALSLYDPHPSRACSPLNERTTLLIFLNAHHECT